MDLFHLFADPLFHLPVQFSEVTEIIKYYCFKGIQFHLLQVTCWIVRHQNGHALTECNNSIILSCQICSDVMFSINVKIKMPVSHLTDLLVFYEYYAFACVL